MKKILVLNNEFPPLGGGQANANKYIFEQFKNYKEYEFTLITSSVDTYKFQEFSDNIKIYYLDIGKKNHNYHFQTIKDLLIYSWKTFFFFYKNFRKEKYDLIVCFSGVPAGFLGFIIKILFQIPYIVLLRGSDVPFYEKRWYYLDKFIFSWLSPFIWKQAKYVTALSLDLKNMAQKVYNGKIDVIYNGIDINEFLPNFELRKSQLNINILFVGRLVERKGIIYLLQAFEQLSQKYEKISLLLAGDGPLKNDLEKFVGEKKLQEKVKILGLVKHEDLSHLYQISHIFVVPSLNEALGNVTQEAIASGLPIITTHTGAAELLDENGFIIEKQNIGDIIEKLTILLDNNDLREKMSQKSRELSLKMSWEKVAEKYVNIFDNII